MDLSTAIFSFLSGLLGAMGFGGGTVLIIYLTSFISLEQKEAQGINLIFFIFTGAVSFFFNNRNGLTDKKIIPSLIPLSIAGLVSGYMLLPIIDAAILKKMFGGVLLILGLRELFSMQESKHRR